MKVLIVGSGGREHALAWKVAQSEFVDEVFVAPGNAGTALETNVRNIEISAEDIPALVQFAESHSVELTIIGPEIPLVAGVVDAFQNRGLPCFGPSRAAAQLEGSKAFTKAFLARHGIPTANYAEFFELESAREYIRTSAIPIVIKADGLAAGKGVVVAESREQAYQAVESMLQDDDFGEAGRRIVIEEYLRGEEASFICLVDGQHALPMASSQDHKARDDGDRGPNTGGMGAYSPAPVLSPDISERIMREVIEPTVAGMAEEGHPFSGFLYAGLMITPEGVPKVIEFNCRFGDPEAQPIMMRLESDLVPLCLASLKGQLDEMSIRWDSRPCVGVVMAAAGYPLTYDKGDEIVGLETIESTAKVFHAGTRADGERIVTNGGRVLCVCAYGDNITGATNNAYREVERIHWSNAYYRKDIAHRAIQRERG